jgi:uncharacterized protein YerC
MPRVSRNKLNQTELQEIGKHFSYLISSLKDNNEIENFFSEFLTKEEETMLFKRLVLCMMLKKNYSAVEIKSALRISYETVRSYQHQLDYKTHLFHKTIERLLSHEKTVVFFEKIEKILKAVELVGKAKTNIKARAKIASGDWS